MGRGRQKAKQTKVARQLKYFSPETDYQALQRELSTGNGINTHTEASESDEEDDLTEDQLNDAGYPGHRPRRRY
jgi:hypothetical protein